MTSRNTRNGAAATSTTIDAATLVSQVEAVFTDADAARATALRNLASVRTARTNVMQRVRDGLLRNRDPDLWLRRPVQGTVVWRRLQSLRAGRNVRPGQGWLLQRRRHLPGQRAPMRRPQRLVRDRQRLRRASAHVRRLRQRQLRQVRVHR